MKRSLLAFIVGLMFSLCNSKSEDIDSMTNDELYLSATPDYEMSPEERRKEELRKEELRKKVLREKELRNEEKRKEEKQKSEYRFSNGVYNAEVRYFNPETGTRSYYTLTVAVESDEVVQINFRNGGHLDDSHISMGGRLDHKGRTTLITDRGVEFRVKLGELTNEETLEEEVGEVEY